MSSSTTSPSAARARPDTQLDEQKRSFLRTVSHELRTPLNAVIGFSEIVSSEAYGPLGAPQYKEYAELIRQSGYKLLKLVNQIVDIAKLEGRAMDLELEAEQLDFALDDALVGLQQEIAERKLKVVVEDDGKLPSVMADTRGLRTMLVNLLQNAVFYSPDGGTVTIRARKDDDCVELEIQDEGEGVPAQDIPRLMKPFEQGENALTRSAQGVGLGLPIVGLLSQAMGGSLRLHSAPGEGMTAIICLPTA
ncbi:MAG TPA: HAMP domain-containing sensor histidine kinase [Caulobacteraceae bacterium]|nr:HAMP domain-containing sensor histidine kinase [Caulobacteraceae bacterium]